MIKFLTRYNKWILAIGGTLLMITFLIPQAITHFGQTMGQASARWATIGPNNRQISAAEQRDVQLELRLLTETQLNRLHPNLTVTRPEHWYLLTLEAEKAGLIPGPGAVYEFMAPDSRDAILAGIRGSIGGTRDFVLRAMAKRDGVSGLLAQFLGAAPMSDRRMTVDSARLFSSATAELVIIQADKPSTPVTFTEAQLLEQFEANKTKLPGEGEKGFGYKLPNRVKIEYLTIPAASVRNRIAASDELSGVALRRYWRENATTPGFGMEAPSLPVPDVVRESLLNHLTTKRLADIAKFANDNLRLNRRGVSTTAGYLNLPENFAEDLPKLAQSIQQHFRIELPAYEALGDRWLDDKSVTELPAIGAATTDKFGAPISVSSLIRSLKEFGGSDTAPVQQGVAFPPLSDLDGNLYVVRVTDASPAHVPASLDEVREQVVADLNRIAHFAELETQVSEVQNMAVNAGLLAVADAHDTTIQPRSSLSTFGQMPLPNIGASKDAMDQLMVKAMALPTSLALDELPARDRIVTVAAADKLALIVARFIEVRPLTREDYTMYMSNGFAQRFLGEDEIKPDDLIEAFSFETLAARHNFKLANPATDEEDETAPPANPATARVN